MEEFDFENFKKMKNYFFGNFQILYRKNIFSYVNFYNEKILFLYKISNFK